MPRKLASLIADTGLKFLWISVVVFFLDQWSKNAIVESMTLFESQQLLPFFNLTYVHNYGAAFSFLSDAGGWQRWFFSGIAFVVSAVILWWLVKSEKNQKLLPIAFTLILGGALGNVYDRVVYGYVIDFLDFYIRGWHWPAFNLADSAIFLGAALLILDMFINGEQHKQDKSKGSAL